MTVYSKLLPYTCYEMGHTWHPSCTKCFFDMFVSAFYESMKIYGVVYTAMVLVSKKKLSLAYVKQVLRNYIRSVLFLTYSGCFYVGAFCVCRMMLGHIHLLSVSWLPSFISSLLSIFVERPSRRSQLTIYVCNVASESLWNVLKDRGYVKPIHKGEVLLFSLSMVVFGYYFKKTKKVTSLVNSIMVFLLGKDESGEGEERTIKPPPPAPMKPPLSQSFKYSYLFKWKHPKCPHEGSCIPNAIKGAAKTGLKGYALQVCLTALTAFPKMVKRPSMLLQILGRKSSLRCGAAFALFASVFKFSCCLGRQVSKEDKAVHGAFAGALAGLSMALYPSTSLAIYAFWKALEKVYEKGIEAGYLPSIPYGLELIYSFATAYLFHLAIVEYFNLKPSYLAFLTKFSDKKIRGFNTILLDVYGLDSGRKQPWPNYDKNYLTKEFIEKFYK